MVACPRRDMPDGAVAWSGLKGRGAEGAPLESARLTTLARSCESQTGIQQSFIVCVLVRPWPCRCCAAAAAAIREPQRIGLENTGLFQ